MYKIDGLTSHDSAVRVVLRFRPTTEKSTSNFLKLDKDKQTVHISTEQSATVKTHSRRHSISTTKSDFHRFVFDRVFADTSTQEEVYNETAAPLVDDILRGFNATIFAYGQTGSGKTYTMQGPSIEDPTHQGLCPRLITHLFDRIEEMKTNKDVELILKVNCIEIYQERINDLLDRTRENLRLRHHQTRGFYVEKCSEIYVNSARDVIELMKRGFGNRRTASTNMNAESSRSHSIFILHITQQHLNKEINSRLILIDLAGSEKVSKTGAEGQTLEEAKTINKSLLTLGNVINALTEKNTFVPYRDSALTLLLKESLGGNSKTTLIVNCSMDAYNASESLNTMRFGQRAKRIENKPKINMEQTVGELKQQLEAVQHEYSALLLHNRILSLLSLTRADLTPREHVIHWPLEDSAEKTRDPRPTATVEHVIEMPTPPWAPISWPATPRGPVTPREEPEPISVIPPDLSRVIPPPLAVAVLSKTAFSEETDVNLRPPHISAAQAFSPPGLSAAMWNDHVMFDDTVTWQDLREQQDREFNSPTAVPLQITCQAPPMMQLEVEDATEPEEDLKIVLERRNSSLKKEMESLQRIKLKESDELQAKLIEQQRLVEDLQKQLISARRSRSLLGHVIYNTLFVVLVALVFAAGVHLAPKIDPSLTACQDTSRLFSYDIYFDTLGLTPSASSSLVKQRYRELLLQLHPDKNPQCDDMCHNQLHNAKFSYDILSLAKFHKEGAEDKSVECHCATCPEVTCPEPACPEPVACQPTSPECRCPELACPEPVTCQCPEPIKCPTPVTCETPAPVECHCPAPVECHCPAPVACDRSLEEETLGELNIVLRESLDSCQRQVKHCQEQLVHEQSIVRDLELKIEQFQPTVVVQEPRPEVTRPDAAKEDRSLQWMLEEEKKKQLGLITTHHALTYWHSAAEDSARLDRSTASLTAALKSNADFHSRMRAVDTEDAEIITKYGIAPSQSYLVAETTITIMSRDDEQQQQMKTTMTFPGPFSDEKLTQLVQNFLNWQASDHILLGDFDTLPCLSTGARVQQYCVVMMADTMSRSSFDLGSRILKYLELASQFTERSVHVSPGTEFTFRLIDTGRKESLYDHMSRDLELVSNAHTQLHHQLIVVSLHTAQFWQYDRPLTFQRATDYPALIAWLNKVLRAVERGQEEDTTVGKSLRAQEPVPANNPDLALIEYTRRRHSPVSTVVSYGVTLGLAVNFLLRLTRRALQLLG